MLAWPWATVVVASAAGAIFWASAENRLIFERGLILHGQLWRAWTAHLVHFTPSHLWWNLAVLVPAGCWLERQWPRITRWYYLYSPPAISAALLLFDSALERYAGLSGVATGVLVLLAGLQFADGDRPDLRWFSISLLVLVAAKIGYEFLAGTPLLVQGFDEVRNVPLAHLAGAAFGGLFWVFGARLRQ
jgi:rhomboid family GlyGly-CTERM serine protease